MNKRLSIALVVIVMSLGSTTAWAGIEPSPFRVSLVKLENVTTALSGSARMVTLLMAYDATVAGVSDDEICYPPQPGMDVLPLPPGCTISSNNLAEEYRNQAKLVQRQEEQVYDVTKHPPEPGLFAQLRAVREGALAILGTIQAATPLDDNKVNNAMAKLERNLQSLIEMVDAHLASGG